MIWMPQCVIAACCKKRGPGRRMHVPNPLSYFPQVTMRATSQLMVRMQASAQSDPSYCDASANWHSGHTMQTFRQRLENTFRFWCFHIMHDYPAFYNMVTKL